MKGFKKLASLLVAVMFLFGVACAPSDVLDNGSQTSSGNTDNKAQNTVTPTAFGEVEGEMHDYKMTETDKYIVKDGRTDYKILIPEGMADNEFISSAVSDLRLLFSEATGGLELEVVEDNVDLADGKFLAIHSTKLASAESVGATYDVLGMGGFRIKTVNDSVIMCGATAEASMYAVYSFLEVALGFEQFYTDFYALDKNVRNLKLMNYDVTDVPDFEYRIQSSGWIRYNDQNRKRMRWTEERSWIIPADDNNMTWHNTFVYLPPDTYKKKHPEWYSEPKANQLCYTAHGDEESRTEMLDIVATRVIELFSMEKYKDYRHISISIEDNQNCCTCPTCVAEKEKYGADSAVIVKFCNDVAKRVSAWMETEEGKPYARDFRILFFAYHATNAAPAKYDEKLDKYVSIDDSVICDPHVAVYFAETNGDYTANFHDEGTANTQIGKNMQGWGACSKEVYFWSYSTNFSHFLTPYNSFDTVQDILKFAKKENAMFIMIQDQWIQQAAQTGFGIFKNWLHSKLEWNVNADMEALADEFFDGYFMDASATMRQVYDEYRVWAKHQTEDLGYNGYRSVYFNPLKAELWPQRMLERWISMIDRAQAEISHYKSTDATLYNQLVDHMAIESLAFRYLLVTLYADSYEPDALTSIKKTFATDISRIGMNLVASTSQQSIQSLLTQWGV